MKQRDTEREPKENEDREEGEKNVLLSYRVFSCFQTISCSMKSFTIVIFFWIAVPVAGEVPTVLIKNGSSQNFGIGSNLLEISANVRRVLVYPQGNVSVLCTGSGDPQPELRWIIEGWEITEKKRAPHLELSLIMRNMTLICHAENSGGTATQKLEIVVTDENLAPAALIRDDNSGIMKNNENGRNQLSEISPNVQRVLVAPQGSVSVFCDGYGFPRPKLYWIIENWAISTEKWSHHLALSLITKNMTATCHAENSEGHSTQTLEIVVAEPASEPRSVKFSIEPDNSVLISWQPPEYPNGNLKHYNLYLLGNNTRVLQKAQMFVVKASPKPSIPFLKGELHPRTYYTVTVAAVNQYGEGPKSVPRHFATVNQSPLDPPSNVAALFDDESVQISWDAPRRPNGAIKEYTVEYCPDVATESPGFEKWRRVQVQSFVRPFFLNMTGNGLTANTWYKVRVAAKNGFGEGPFSQSIKCFTGTVTDPSRDK